MLPIRKVLPFYLEVTAYGKSAVGNHNMSVRKRALSRPGAVSLDEGTGRLSPPPSVWTRQRIFGET